MNWKDECYAMYLNLDSRGDRKIHIEKELAKIGLKADRMRGKLPSEYDLNDGKYRVMKNRTPGAIGCYEGQLNIIREALSQDKHAIVLEDDCIFCEDFNERMEIVWKFLEDKEWDIFWLGATFHKEPTWHKNINGKHTHPELKQCNCNKNCDWELTENPNIVKTYGIWSTYGWIVNKDKAEKIVELFDKNMNISMGIDWTAILLQPQLNTYSFIPGMVKQLVNQSNIGTGITDFEKFSSLGEHWYKNKL